MTTTIKTKKIHHVCLLSTEFPMKCMSGKSCYKTVSFRFSNLPELQSGHFPSHVFTTDTCTALFSSIQNKFLFLCYYLIQLPKRYSSTMRPAQTTVFCLLHYYKTQFIRLSYVFVHCVIERERERGVTFRIHKNC